MDRPEHVRVERDGDLEVSNATFVDGLPGLGLVSVIVVEHLVEEFGLERYGTVESDRFPQVATFSNGRLRDPVRAYASTDPPVVTLQSDLAFPPRSFHAIADAVEALASSFDRAVFLVGAPAESESSVGSVRGVATPDLSDRLGSAGIDPVEELGAVGGATGAAVRRCQQLGVPTAVVVVESNPFRPDPAAAREVIEEGLSPLLGVDADTSQLAEREAAIRDEMRQMAAEIRRLEESSRAEPVPEEADLNMFQ